MSVVSGGATTFASQGRTKNSLIITFPFSKSVFKWRKNETWDQLWKIYPFCKIIGFQAFIIAYFTCGFPPAKEVGYPKSLLEDSWRMMMNDEVMWSCSVNENYYDDFPLASIFDPIILNLPLNSNSFPFPLKNVGEIWIIRGMQSLVRRPSKSLQSSPNDQVKNTKDQSVLGSEGPFEIIGDLWTLMHLKWIPYYDWILKVSRKNIERSKNNDFCLILSFCAVFDEK